MTTSSLYVVDEEIVFITQADKEMETEEQTLDHELQSRKNAADFATNEEPCLSESIIREFTKIDGATT